MAAAASSSADGKSALEAQFVGAFCYLGCVGLDRGLEGFLGSFRHVCL